jgi:hypothetical protein
VEMAQRDENFEKGKEEIKQGILKGEVSPYH